jgi:hypothetical protein
MYCTYVPTFECRSQIERTRTAGSHRESRRVRCARGLLSNHGEIGSPDGDRPPGAEAPGGQADPDPRARVLRVFCKRDHLPEQREERPSACLASDFFISVRVFTCMRACFTDVRERCEHTSVRAFVGACTGSPSPVRVLPEEPCDGARRSARPLVVICVITCLHLPACMPMFAPATSPTIDDQGKRPTTLRIVQGVLFVLALLFMAKVMAQFLGLFVERHPK